ncbi:MAG TPA: hypothetical protein VNQ79_11580 [Blastocatellia bacterium]|nr:hypothetical protein [Blastocatellia bacterium]
MANRHRPPLLPTESEAPELHGSDSGRLWQELSEALAKDQQRTGRLEQSRLRGQLMRAALRNFKPRQRPFSSKAPDEG